MFKRKDVYLRCADYAETAVFSKYISEHNGEVDYEFTIEDSYCGYDLMGIKNRFKRAWKAFCAKPIAYTGVYCEDTERMRKFLNDCLALMDEQSDKKEEV